MNGEDKENRPRRLKPVLILRPFAARLKAVPFQNSAEQGVFPQPVEPAHHEAFTAGLKPGTLKRTVRLCEQVFGIAAYGTYGRIGSVLKRDVIHCR
jgi:hypothetical protein